LIKLTPEEELIAHLSQSKIDVTHAEAAPAVPGVVVSDEAKLAFLAHILQGVPFRQYYDIANVGYIIFATVPTAEAERIYDLARGEEALGSAASPSNRRERIRSYMAAASVEKLVVGTNTYIGVQPFDLTAYAAFSEKLPAGLLSAIEHSYSAFSTTLKTLIESVTDRSFWPAL
jgi:hypothetical protein